MKKRLLISLLFFAIAMNNLESFAQNNSEGDLFLKNSNRIVKILKVNNYFELLENVSPDFGLRFSPYAHIDTINDTKLSPERIKAIIKSKESILWGTYDGTGDSIFLSLAKYHLKFVYDVDFENAEKIKVDQFIGSGNSLNNLKKAYPNCRFVEYYFSGFDKKLGGMDWKTLRLVFKRKKGKYYLVGIVHDQWTI